MECSGDPSSTPPTRTAIETGQRACRQPPWTCRTTCRRTCPWPRQRQGQRQPTRSASAAATDWGQVTASAKARASARASDPTAVRNGVGAPSPLCALLSLRVSRPAAESAQTQAGAKCAGLGRRPVGSVRVCSTAFRASRGSAASRSPSEASLGRLLWHWLAGGARDPSAMPPRGSIQPVKRTRGGSERPRASSHSCASLSACHSHSTRDSKTSSRFENLSQARETSNL